MNVNAVNKHCPQIAVNFSHGDYRYIERCNRCVNETGFIDDDLYSRVYATCKSVFPDMEWSVRTEWQSWAKINGEIRVKISGKYERMAARGEYYPSFDIELDVIKAIYRDTKNKYWEVRYEMERDGKRLTAANLDKVADLIKHQNCTHRSAEVSLNKPDNVIEVVKHILNSKAKLVNKYIENDRTTRKNSATAQLSIDVELLGIKSELDAICKANSMDELTEINNLSIRQLASNMNSGYIGVDVDGLHSTARIKVGVCEIYQGSNEYNILKLVENMYKAKSLDGNNYAIDDPKLIKDFSTVCKMYGQLKSVVDNIVMEERE